ncbi:hypothetical protein TorRG33x02_083060 [Trema orientale]|uniref:Uncharacterized protein n=1 Tax=Trema orientale TaxID=63057 RepID=A0A2P5FDB5_TREOI|nr:hypothetical protein TorRG33x02_083060 [Trema orientale]
MGGSFGSLKCEGTYLPAHARSSTPGCRYLYSSAGVQVTHSTIRWWRPKRSWGTFLSGVGAPMVTPKEGCHADHPLVPFSL